MPPPAPFTTPSHAWWQTGVVYQIYPRSFRDANGDGVGDLAGVIEKLDYLSDTLGVDALWLSPFYPSPMADFGYDVSDYTDVDPVFGDLAAFDRLMDEAHARGLKVIIDYVPNHSSDQHAWFIESRASTDSPKRDWYVWRDAGPDGGRPNNWLSVFGGPAWEWDDATGQYYLHSFLREQPDLNWRNPEVKDAMFDVLRFWLERGVDGFRIDVAHAIMKDPELRDNPPNPQPEGSFHKPMGEYGTQLHLNDKNHPDIHGLYQEMRRLFDAYSKGRPRVSIGEMHIYDWPVWARYYGEAQDELHMPFNFALLNTAWEAAAVRASVDALEAAIPEGAWPNYVLGNHDERRMASRLGAAQARVAAVLLLTLRGTPTLYYGDELGMQEVVVPPEKQQDPWGMRSLPELSRDGCRTPMPWDGGPSAGFSDAPPEVLWLPLHDDLASVNVAAQLGDPASMLNLYRRLLRLRRRTHALQTGSYQPLDDAPAGVFAYVREAGDERVLAALNFSSQPRQLTVPQSRVLLSTNGERDGEATEATLTLAGDEAVVVEIPAILPSMPS